MTELQDLFERATDRIEAPRLAGVALATAGRRRTRRRAMVVVVASITAVLSVFAVAQVGRDARTGPPTTIITPTAAPRSTTSPVPVAPATAPPIPESAIQPAWDPANVEDLPFSNVMLPRVLQPWTDVDLGDARVLAMVNDADSTWLVSDGELWERVGSIAEGRTRLGISDRPAPLGAEGGGGWAPDGSYVETGANRLNGFHRTVDWYVGGERARTEADNLGLLLNPVTDGLSVAAIRTASTYRDPRHGIDHDGVLAFTRNGARTRAYLPVKSQEGRYGEGEGRLHALGWLDPDTVLLSVIPVESGDLTSGTRYLVTWDVETGALGLASQLPARCQLSVGIETWQPEDLLGVVRRP